MGMDLVIDIGNSRIKGGLFEGKTLIHAFSVVDADEIRSHLAAKPIRNALIASVNEQTESSVAQYCEREKIPFSFIDNKNIKLVLDVEEPEALGHDRIANAYGALAQFPLNDCIVIDIGTAITADFVEKEGRYTGGMIYPGAILCAKALADYTNKLPLVPPNKPTSPLGKTTKTHIESGIYYGQLGAIERMIAELRMISPSPSSIQVIATGGSTAQDCGFIEDLKELVDAIEPHLTLIGLREILYERLNQKE